MSNGINFLHSHSGIERSTPQTLRDKAHVIVDKRFRVLFPDALCEEFKYKERTYIKVPTYLFYKRGGVFKNLNE